MSTPPRRGDFREFSAFIGQAGFISLAFALCAYDELPPPVFWAWATLSALALAVSAVSLLLSFWHQS